MADYEVISWISPFGYETVFSNQDWIDVVGWRGFDMVEVVHIEEEVPFEHGSRYKRTKILPRELELDMIVWRESREGLFFMLRILRSTFDFHHQQYGQGKLKVVTPEGAEYLIDCMYKEGLEGRSGMDDGVSWRKLTLVFRAFDPFFYPAIPVNLTFSVQESQPQWFPLLPMQLGGDAISAEFEVHNDGHTEAFPLWTIKGPGINPILTNVTTGKSLQLSNVTLEAGQTITIDTRSRLIQHSNGSNLFSNLAWGTGLWLLEKGSNHIRLEFPSADVDSLIQLTFAQRFLGV